MDILLLIVQIAVSVAVVIIACRQYITSKTQLRLNLYNKRYAVFEKTLNYYYAYMFSEPNSEIDPKIKADFGRAYTESRFLFGSNSPVYHKLTNIKSWAEEKESKSSPEPLLKALEDELIESLDFRRIEIGQGGLWNRITSCCTRKNYSLRS